jgi:hypothetical protein
MVKGNMSKFESQIDLFEFRGNFCLNACVLSRSCFNDFQKPQYVQVLKTRFAKFGFAKGLAKGKLGGAC